MEISASAVRDLREKTGAGMMDCKKALTECAGDMEKAIDWLRKKGMSQADKKASRIASEGTVSAWLSPDAKVGVLVEVNCETDFVAKNTDFKGYIVDLNQQVASNKSAPTGSVTDAASMMEQSFYKDSGKTVALVQKELVAKLGENINFRRFAKFDLTSGKPGVLTSYVHGDGKIAVLVELGCENPGTSSKEEAKVAAKDIALHVAASGPKYISGSEVPQNVLEKEKDFLRSQAAQSGKPAAVIEKIVEGRVSKYLAEICLVDQPFVKDPDKTINKYLAEASSKVADKLTVRRFARIVMGDGLQKKDENFADEVAKAQKGM